MNRRWVSLILGALLTTGFAGSSMAEEVNCSNEFRSGKLYFAQGVFGKSVERFAVAAEVCPDEWEYRARYAMALCEHGNAQLVEALTKADTREAQDALIAAAVESYTKAGQEFDAALAVNDRKKTAKFVRENREHYWVDHYNRGIKLYEEEKYVAAEREFRLARLVDAKNPKTYNQGAVSLIQMDMRTEAAELVQQGLELDPENEMLNNLIESIYMDAARSLTKKSEGAAQVAREFRDSGDAAKTVETADGAVALAMEAVGYYEKVSERREHGDANVIFDRGVAHMAAGSAEAVKGAENKSVFMAHFVDAAGDFAKAAELVPASDPDENNRAFHKSALFNLAQANMSADDWAGTTDTIKRYLSLDPLDLAVWKMYATVLSIQDKSEGAVAALMVSKSLGGQEVPVDDAVSGAKADAAAALSSLGPPDKIYAYQEPDSGNQINTWIWPEKKTVKSFILGIEQGEMSW